MVVCILEHWNFKLLHCSHCFDEITKIFNPFAILSSIIESLLKTQTAYKLEWSLRMNQIQETFSSFSIFTQNYKFTNDLVAAWFLSFNPKFDIYLDISFIFCTWQTKLMMQWFTYLHIVTLWLWESYFVFF